MNLKNLLFDEQTNLVCSKNDDSSIREKRFLPPIPTTYALKCCVLVCYR